MHVIRIPAFRAVSSGLRTFEDIFGEGDKLLGISQQQIFLPLNPRI